MTTLRRDQPIIGADGIVLYAPNPPDLATLATPEPAPGGGLLYLGGGWARYPRWERYDLAVAVCGHHEAAPGPAANRSLEYELDDNGWVDPYVEYLADEVADTVEYGHAVLVRCYTGQNRSGLVVARAMHRLYGMTGADAIGHLRAVRSPNVLCNPAFERYVREAA